MFRIISIAALLAAFAAVLVHCMASRSVPKQPGQSKPKRSGLLGILDILSQLAYIVGIVCFAALMFTGFFPSLVLGQKISGYWLMVHVSAGGAFAVCLAFLALMFAERCSFNKSDCPPLQKLFGKEIPEQGQLQAFNSGLKISFWLIILLALPVILSIIASMFPLAGTDGQEFLMQLHRYCAIALAVVAVIHIYVISQRAFKK